MLGDFPASILAIVMCLFISSNIIRGFLSSCYRFSTRRFPRRVISHPYCYVHYDVLDTTCVIGCLMNDILILFLCLLSRMLFGVFLTSFSSVLAYFPASFLSSKPLNRKTLKHLHFFFVYYPEYHSGLSYIFRFSARVFLQEFLFPQPSACAPQSPIKLLLPLSPQK